MPNVKRLAMIATYVLLGTAACAEEPPTPSVEERLANIERMLAANSQVQPAAYPQMMAQNDVLYDAIPYEASAQQELPSKPVPTQILQDESALFEEYHKEFPNQIEILHEVRPRSQTWSAGIEIIPARVLSGGWPYWGWDRDDNSTGIRFTADCERDEGYGTRIRVWTIGNSDDNYSGDVDIEASSLSLDFYKRILFEQTELIFGAGGNASRVEFSAGRPLSGLQQTFTGGGANIFAEMFHPIWILNQTALGIVGRGRTSFAYGNWTRGSSDIVTPDTFYVTEVAFGLQLRRYFGVQNCKLWHVGCLVEGQRWDYSDFYSAPVKVTGLNINTGLGW